MMRRFLLWTVVVLAMSPAFVGAAEPASLKWKIKMLAVDSNEGIDVADFNKDGKLDIVAGRNWYAAPDFVARPVRTIEDWNGYVRSNGDYAMDVDGDGWTDVVAGDFVPSEVYWFKNPGLKGLQLGKMWPKKLLVDTKASQNEGQLLHDLDGDGRPEWVVNSWGKNTPMFAWKFTKRTVEETKKGKKKTTVPSMRRLLVGTKGNGHGMGFGDINGDGREDILSGLGWYERPAKAPFKTEWKFHRDWEIHASVPVYVRDINGDGHNDIVWGKGHDFGLQWWEQLPASDGKTQWKTHVIDNKFSQPHSLHFADLDGDGKEDLITGKRYYAHNGRDPGGQLKPCLYYYTFDKKSTKFTKHVIDEGQVGTGLQIRTGDLNNDGKLDIAVAGKSGTYILFNQGR